MNTPTKPKSAIEETIERIAGRLVLKAKKVAVHWGALQEKRQRVAEIPFGMNGREAMLQELDARLAQLDRAATDYEHAERMVRAFPGLLAAARHFEDSADGGDPVHWFAVETAEKALRYPCDQPIAESVKNRP